MFRKINSSGMGGVFKVMLKGVGDFLGRNFAHILLGTSFIVYAFTGEIVVLPWVLATWVLATWFFHLIAQMSQETTRDALDISKQGVEIMDMMQAELNRQLDLLKQAGEIIKKLEENQK